MLKRKMQNSKNNGEKSDRIPYIVRTYQYGFKSAGRKFWSKNNPQHSPESWDNVAIKIEEEKDLTGTRMYQKDLCYPEGRYEYCPEEYRAYKWFAEKGIQNKFTSSRDVVWKEKLNQLPCIPEVNDVEMSESSLGLSLFEPPDNTAESEPSNRGESSSAPPQAQLQKDKGSVPSTILPLQKKAQNRLANEINSLRLLPQLNGATAFSRKKSPRAQVVETTEKLSKIVINNKKKQKTQEPFPSTSKVQSVIEPSTDSQDDTLIATVIAIESNLNDEIENSIYSEADENLEHQQESWEEVRECDDPEEQYIATQNDLNESLVVLEEHKKRNIFNPFSKSLHDALLNKLQFIEQLKSFPNCNLKKIVRPLAKGQELECGAETFDIIKAVGKGAYGTVFR